LQYISVKAAFLICVTYAAVGIVYAPSWYSISAFIFIGASSAPLLVASTCERSFETLARIRPSFIFFGAAFGGGMFNLAIVLAGIDHTPQDAMSADGLASAALASTARRYEELGASGNPFLLAVSLFLLFRIGVVANLVGLITKLLAFLPVVFYTLITTEKWPLFLGAAFFLSGAIMATTAPIRRLMVYGAWIVCIGTVLAGLSFVLRGFDGEVSAIGLRVIHYAASQYSAFGEWLAANAFSACCTFGERTFIGPLHALGITYRARGIFEEYLLVRDMPTNVYTAWRYLVEDFSILGPLFVNTLAATAYASLQTLRLTAAGLSLKLLIILSSILSLATPLFTYNSVVLAFCLAVVYTFIATRRPNHDSISPLVPARALRCG
jgi:hypothetical protein